MGSNAWVAAHLFAMIGFILLPLGLMAVRNTIRRTRAESTALSAIVTTWIGAGLTLPYYGAEDFGLNAIARATAQGQSLDLPNLAQAIRFGPTAATTFLVGLSALSAGAILVAIAIWRSGVLPRYSGSLFAVAFCLFIPQFFLPPVARIGHGLLVAAGLVWLAFVVWNAKPAGAH